MTPTDPAGASVALHGVCTSDSAPDFDFDNGAGYLVGFAHEDVAQRKTLRFLDDELYERVAQPAFNSAAPAARSTYSSNRRSGDLSARG